ncbi:uncharacterized protein DNG_08736 [Cephalotrichum gorgonifer]|uniref:Uncharacterized protein n=1 Tax=Cephalotrichum gorgonifer TaxID=2041049 RepID=A0AAE8SZF9_9PEZI|nr:uncharacterized protein DNG_08736 [Cephalotrichum gorgonifer]
MPKYTSFREMVDCNRGSNRDLLVATTCDYKFHLTIYHIEKGVHKIWVRTLPDSDSLYPGKLDLTASERLQPNDKAAGECFARMIRRTIPNTKHTTTGLCLTGLNMHRNVSYFATSDKMGGEDHALSGAGIMAHGSVDTKETMIVPINAEGNNEEFSLYTAAEIKETLLDGRWKPSSALVMLRFLIEIGAITKDDLRQGVKRFDKKLSRDLGVLLSQKGATFRAKKVTKGLPSTLNILLDKFSDRPVKYRRYLVWSM